MSRICACGEQRPKGLGTRIILLLVFTNGEAVAVAVAVADTDVDANADCGDIKKMMCDYHQLHR